jgi:hypothetical protein
MATQFRIRHKRLGDFVDGVLMKGAPGSAGFAICAHLLLRAAEFEDLRGACPGIEFILDTAPAPGGSR